MYVHYIASPGPYCAADVQYKFIFLPNLCIQGHDVNCMNKIYGHHSFGRRFNAYFLAGSCPLWGYASKDPQRMAIIHFPDLSTHSNMKTPTGNHSTTEHVQQANTQAKWILNDACSKSKKEYTEKQYNTDPGACTIHRVVTNRHGNKWKEHHQTPNRGK